MGRREASRGPLLLLRGALGWSWLLCLPGGVLWALSPLGVYLSEYKYKTPEVFWRLFPSAPLLMLAGLAGLYLHLFARRGRRPGALERVGFAVCALGALLTVAGDVGKFYLHLDDVYLMSAPAYRTMRAGLALLCGGALLFGFGLARERRVALAGALPFAIGSLAGLIAVLRDFGALGEAMWVMFGAGWAWVGIVVLFGEGRRLLAGRKSGRGRLNAGETSI
ncbi:hypothetical protein Rxyl_2685 [Rubrobacter xylanophilus DSM 9941]|uniref:DUF998 domain-containing protein n=1 Tax=Rubrobacter xylanophilus (strain DSM 9941 / JCM 11954 / NBRC 16129 / PRD-1) TaxID=266117 RepID=Q1ASM6_RUBXD|nr:hypothetical protein [Rubrobacter xylanophilus]ABG05602.1 hypothetical protein Rxyl_2685 [Rubrobacter xylanophilus DSM 9941]